jgi:hypothetical protein
VRSNLDYSASRRSTGTPRPLLAPSGKLQFVYFQSRVAQIDKQRPRRAGFCFFVVAITGLHCPGDFTYPDAFGHRLVHEREAERIIGCVQGLVELREQV